MNKKKKTTYEKYLELTKEELALKLIFAEDRIEKLVLEIKNAKEVDDKPELLLEKK